MFPRPLIALTVIALLVCAVLALVPSLDIAASRLFWEEGEGFWLSREPWARVVRELSMWPTAVMAAAALIAIVLKLAFPSSRMLLPGRLSVFFVVTVALGPLLVVNGILKEHWERARPVQVQAFGGPFQFTPWWQPGSGRECTRNCSFISGEASGAAWLTAPALLAPPPWRIAALTAVGVYTAFISTLRIGFGGHFLSDVILGALVTVWIIWLSYWWLVLSRRAVGEEAWAGRLGNWGDGIQFVVLRAGAAIVALTLGLARFIRRPR